MDEVLKLITDVLPYWVFECQFLINYGLSGFFFVISLEGHTCTYERVKQHSEAPNVSLEVTRLVLYNLRGHVAESP